MKREIKDTLMLSNMSFEFESGRMIYIETYRDLRDNTTAMRFFTDPENRDEGIEKLSHNEKSKILSVLGGAHMILKMEEVE